MNAYDRLFAFLRNESGLTMKKASGLMQLYMDAVMLGWHPPQGIETVGELAESILDYFRIYSDDEIALKELEAFLPTDCDIVIDVDLNAIDEFKRDMCEQFLNEFLSALRETPD